MPQPEPGGRFAFRQVALAGADLPELRPSSGDDPQAHAGKDPEAQLQDWGIRYGEPLAGFDLSSSLPLTADSTDCPVRWTHGPDIAGLGGRLLAFRFHLRNASLYGFWID